MDQKQAIKELRKGKNALIVGKAGVGKSYIIKEYIDECEQNGKKVLITAPTGIAAVNIGGVTMHKAFGIHVPAYGYSEKDVKLSAIKEACNADVIIIDEIPTCRNDVFEYFAMVMSVIKKKLLNTGKE